MAEPTKLFRPINQSLGQQPSLGPIPANLLAPTGAILVTAYVLVKVILNLGFASFLLLECLGHQHLVDGGGRESLEIYQQVRECSRLDSWTCFLSTAAL